jgi:hypothetical protein
MGIVLTVALKLLSIFPEDSLEHIRSNDRAVHVPHFIQGLGVRHYKPSFSTQRIFFRFFLDKFESLIKEKFRQFIRVWKALQTAIHVASITKIVKPNLTIFTVGPFFHLDVAQLRICLKAALGHMKSFIFFHTGLIAVSNSLTLANVGKLIPCITPFTRTNENALLLFIFEGETCRGNLY